jgi:peptidylprolyl isomerase
MLRPARGPLAAARTLQTTPTTGDKQLPQSRKRRTARRTHPGRTSFGAQDGTQRHAKQKRTRVIAVVIIVALAAGAAAYLFVPKLSGGAGAEVTTRSGLKYTDIVVGTGPSPRPGQTAVVHYTGTLQKDGTKFDSSRDRGQPYSFPLGMGRVIPGWDEGVATMKVGGRRQLVVPPALGYGATGSGKIPPNATLNFDIELLDVK